MSEITRPAPRVAASPNSLAAAHAALPLPPGHVRSRLRAAVASLAASAATLLNGARPSYCAMGATLVRADERGEGDGRCYIVDWLGIHLTVFVGRTPRAFVSGDEVTA